MSNFANILAILLLTSTCAAAQVQPSNPPGPRTGSIKGTVVTETGQPLQNVVIYLRTFSSLRPVQFGLTDDEGKFEVTGLEPLTFQIFARHSVYSLLPREEGTPNNYHIGDSVKLVMAKGGVVTGTVTSRDGDPVIGVPVRVSAVPNGDFNQERLTDDRGIYRIYGLPSGKYVVSAGGSLGPSSYGPYDGDVPTYSPASTRDTAAEINVRAGEETTNVDIRYRGEPGRTVSGTVSNAPVREDGAGVLITLSLGTEGGAQLSAGTTALAGGRGFAFNGVDDGEYTVIARTFSLDGETSISQPQRINVRGSDVTGIELSLKPMATVSGQVVLEELKTKECGTKEMPVLTESVVSAWHKQDQAAKALPNSVWGLGTPASADAQGSFKLRNLAPGEYYFVTRFAAKSWYLQSVSLASSTTTKKAVDATRVWTAVKSGDRISELKITLAEGAASVSGQVALTEGETLPEKLFVYLVPAEKESGDEVLRFYGAPVSSEGKITLTNLAPGRYWLIARPALDGGLTKLRLPDATETRAKVRREAEALQTEIELKPCQNLVDVKIKGGREATP